jgi:lipid A oxidase
MGLIVDRGMTDMIRAMFLGLPAVRRLPTSPTVDQVGCLLAMIMLVAKVGLTVAQQQVVDKEAGVKSSGPTGSEATVTPTETMVAGYFGAPFTYPSTVHLVNPPATTILTMENVGWDGKPFKSPIYYGVRVARWGGGNSTGMMVDFTHSKTISRPDEEVVVNGLINGAPAPGKAKIGALFKHLEFSHGHNMLTFNGLWRLIGFTPRVSAYVGAGGGIALPHTEVQMIGEPKRTYEYQYAGPVAQALVGIEIRLPSTSLFFEYKFSFADYVVPLSRLEGNLLFTDLWRQAQLWWKGEKPPGGHLATSLASHQVIGGVGVRF